MLQKLTKAKEEFGQVFSLIKGNGMNAPAKASVFYTLGMVITRAAAFLLTPVMTRLLSSEEYGAYTLFNSILSILTIFGTLDICGSVFWRALQKFQDSRRTLLRSALILLLLLCLSALAVFLPIWRMFFRNSLFPGAFIFLALALISNMTVNLFSAKCRFFCKYRFTLISSFILGALAPGLACVFALSVQGNEAMALTVKVGVSTAVLVAFSLPLFIYIIFSERLTNLLYERATLKHEKVIHASVSEEKTSKKSFAEYSRYLLRLALPMFPYYISLSLLAQGDKIIISRLLGASALGAYSVAYSAGSALVALSSGICHALSPWVMRKVRATDYGRIRQVFTAAVDIICPAALIFLALAPEVFSFLAPEEYLGGLSSVFPIALSASPLFLSSLLTSAVLALERVRGVIACGAACALASVVLNLALLRRFGIFAAAVITFTAYLALLLLLNQYFRKIAGKHLVNVNHTLHILFFCAFSAAALFVFRHLTLLRAVFALLALIYLCRRLFGARMLIAEAKHGEINSDKRS